MLIGNKKKNFVKTSLFMGTTVSLTVVTTSSFTEVNHDMKLAFNAFRKVEEVCTRFNKQSEVMQLLNHVGTPVRVSDMLFETVQMAYEVAELTDGAFDPTVGYTLEKHGFNRHYLTREKIISNLPNLSKVSYKDIVLDREKKTILLRKPLIIDLGAVAKGFAIDLAAKILNNYEGFLIDAGGDIYAGGLNEHDEEWKVGVRHPNNTEEIICTLSITNMAVCTSGNYERISPFNQDIQHLIYPNTGITVKDMISSTVLAPFAMMADALSTAAFILGKTDGMKILENNDVNGILVLPSLTFLMTKNIKRYLYES